MHWPITVNYDHELLGSTSMTMSEKEWRESIRDMRRNSPEKNEVIDHIEQLVDQACEEIERDINRSLGMDDDELNEDDESKDDFLE